MKNNCKGIVCCRNEKYEVHQKIGYFTIQRSGNGCKNIFICVENTYIGTSNLRSGSWYVTERVHM